MRKIVFITGTRADFGKLKSLIEITDRSKNFEVHIFVTGMHMQYTYGYTVDEIMKNGYSNIYKFINHTTEKTMDKNLGKTIDGLSDFVGGLKPDLLVVHGDRVEALAGAIVGSLNNILVAHIEGGEVSGTIDELIRHAVSKMSHTHFVSNKIAEKRLLQMGEKPESIFEIGSPDIDVMLSDKLPSIQEVKKRYAIEYEEYGVVLYHPVTTEVNKTAVHSKAFVDALLASKKDFVVIYPNNDLGSSIILKEYDRLKNNKCFKIFPSIRFEYFLAMIKNATCLVGNSSAGIREAPYYGLRTVNIGTRQKNRALNQGIINCQNDYKSIIKAIDKAWGKSIQPSQDFGKGKSDVLFKNVLEEESFWKTSQQKEFVDMKDLTYVSKL